MQSRVKNVHRPVVVVDCIGSRRRASDRLAIDRRLCSRRLIGGIVRRTGFRHPSTAHGSRRAAEI